eukprot:jgi/Psemu1/57192/gm1.57192_g
MSTHRFLCTKNSSHIHVHFWNTEFGHTYDINDKKLAGTHRLKKAPHRLKKVSSFSFRCNLKFLLVIFLDLDHNADVFPLKPSTMALEFLSIFCMINDNSSKDEDSPDKSV